MRNLHPWDLTPPEAMAMQDRLRAELVLQWDGRAVASVAGVDVSVKTGAAHCAIVVFSYPALEPLEAVTADAPLVFPYVPGLLTYREGPAVLAAWERLRRLPDLVMFDGHATAHPRGIGLGAEMGLWLERPSIGVAKSRFIGRHAEPGPRRGATTPLYADDDPSRVIGTVVRTRDRTKPVYVSPGHLIDLVHAVEFTLACCTRYRLPEPTRWAHRVAGGEELKT